MPHAQLLLDGLRQQRVLDPAFDVHQQVEPGPRDVVVLDGGNLETN